MQRIEELVLDLQNRSILRQERAKDYGRIMDQRSSDDTQVRHA